MERLSDLLNEIQPVPETLARIYEGLPEITLAAERERLHQSFIDTGSRILAISQIIETRLI